MANTSSRINNNKRKRGRIALKEGVPPSLDTSSRINKTVLIILVIITILGFIGRNYYLIINSYPPVFVDYVGHTISMIKSLENFNAFFSTNFLINGSNC